MQEQKVIKIKTFSEYLLLTRYIYIFFTILLESSINLLTKYTGKHNL